jgi:hypothetical protein
MGLQRTSLHFLQEHGHSVVRVKPNEGVRAEVQPADFIC